MPGSIEQPKTGSPRESAFAFRPITRADFPMMLRWLHNPTVTAWWTDPPTAIDDLEGKYIPRLDGSDQVYGFIAEYHGRAMGYLQWYRLRTEPEHPAVGLAPPDSAAIDLFIGEDNYLHRGYGSVMIRAFLREVVFAEPDIGHCAIDPCSGNTVAIAAYRKVGFRDIGLAPNPHENCESLIMVIDKDSLAGR
jgi:aminoglycoside 6'-N-acetyltransferase